jgi:hypothetical protein
MKQLVDSLVIFFVPKPKKEVPWIAIMPLEATSFLPTAVSPLQPTSDLHINQPKAPSTGKIITALLLPTSGCPE